MFHCHWGAMLIVSIESTVLLGSAHRGRSAVAWESRRLFRLSPLESRGLVLAKSTSKSWGLVRLSPWITGVHWGISVESHSRRDHQMGPLLGAPNRQKVTFKVVLNNKGYTEFGNTGEQVSTGLSPVPSTWPLSPLWYMWRLSRPLQ